MNSVSIPALPTSATKPRRFKKRRHKPVPARDKEKIDAHKVALGVSHKEILDSLWHRIDWSKYYDAEGNLKTGKRLPRNFWIRHPELNPPIPRTPH